MAKKMPLYTAVNRQLKTREAASYDGWNAVACQVVFLQDCFTGPEWDLFLDGKPAGLLKYGALYLS